MQGDGAEKTEKATPRRRAKAREEGQVALSQEVGVAMAVLVLITAISAILPNTLSQYLSQTNEMLGPIVEAPLTIPETLRVLRNAGFSAAMISGPVALLAMLAGTFASLTQVGIHIYWSNAGIKWQRLDPMNWLKKVFSVELPVNLLKSGFKGLGVVAVAAFGVYDLPARLWRLSGIPPGALMAELQGVALDVAYRVFAALFILAMLDVLWTRHRHEQRLMMSRQEVKDELKDSEGNPQVRGAIRRKMNETSRKKLKESMSQATVVTTNPTHFAVALRYWRGEDVSPIVVAKGADFRAERIRQQASELGVPIIEDPPLTRSLYGLVPEGHQVPVDLYRAVAKLLAIVYRRRGYLEEGQRS